MCDYDKVKYIFGVEFRLRMPDCQFYIKSNKDSRWNLHFDWYRNDRYPDKFRMGKQNARVWTGWFIVTPWLTVSINRYRLRSELPAWDAKYNMDNSYLVV